MRDIKHVENNDSCVDYNPLYSYFRSVVRPLWRLTGKKRKLEDIKLVVDTFAVVAALIMFIPIEAILRNDFHDWDYFHELSQVCHPDGDARDAYSFVQVIEGYKHKWLLCSHSA